MLTIIAFILTILGSINWLMIGLLQYDFIAGIFGYQASLFSRIIYIILGASSVFLVFKLIKNKGTLPVFSWRNKKDLAKNIKKIGNHQKEPLKADNIESSEEFVDDEHSINQSDAPRGLFDEHFDNRGGR